MKPQLKLIKLMDYKAEKIYELTGLPRKMYFNNRDRWAIWQWQDKICKKIWEYIKDTLTMLGNYRVMGLNSSVCPFCARIELDKRYACKNCEYAKTHFPCDFYDSDYQTVKFELQQKRVYGELTCGWYRSIVNQIEKEGSNE